MCLMKKPKVVKAATSTAADKPLPIIRNPYLDGLDPIIRARTGGVRGLTIRRTVNRPPGSKEPLIQLPPVTGEVGGRPPGPVPVPGSTGGGNLSGGSTGNLTPDQTQLLTLLSRLGGSRGAAARSLLL